MIAKRSDGYVHQKPALTQPYMLYQLGYELFINELTGSYTIYAKGHVRGFKVSPYLLKYLQTGLKVSYIIGPYVFMNGFEQTTEGKYLTKMLPLLTDKCKDIIRDNCLFVLQHRAYDIKPVMDKYRNEKPMWRIVDGNNRWSGVEAEMRYGN